MSEAVFSSFEFSGEVVTFGYGGEILAVKSPRFTEIMGRTYIVGSVPRSATNNDWALGCECGVAWEAVTEFMVFQTEDEYIESTSRDQ